MKERGQKRRDLCLRLTWVGKSKKRWDGYTYTYTSPGRGRRSVSVGSKFSRKRLASHSYQTGQFILTRRECVYYSFIYLCSITSDCIRSCSLALPVSLLLLLRNIRSVLESETRIDEEYSFIHLAIFLPSIPIKKFNGPIGFIDFHSSLEIPKNNLLI